MKKSVAIVQSSYIPWKGYFDLIQSVDEFILFDSVQYTRNDWRNRNRIKTPQGLLWLTIPVATKGLRDQRICDTAIVDRSWADQHLTTISRFYSRAPFAADYQPLLAELYRASQEETHLSRINYRFITSICSALGISTKISWSMDHHLPEGKTERLIALCKAVGADTYLSGPSALDYIDPQLFSDAGIELRYANYDGYPEYRQLYPPFTHQVSILDLLLNEGPNARHYLKGNLLCA